MKSEKSAKIKERELIIKLSNEGKTCREIASTLDISKSKVSFWVIRHKETGNLNDKPRSGQPTLLTKDKLKEISEKIKKKLHDQKYKAGISSKEVLQILNKETGKPYSLRHAQRLLHKMGFSLITPRVSHIKKDEKAQNEFRKEFKKSFKRNMWGIRSQPLMKLLSDSSQFIKESGLSKGKGQKVFSSGAIRRSISLVHLLMVKTSITNGTYL